MKPLTYILVAIGALATVTLLTVGAGGLYAYKFYKNAPPLAAADFEAGTASTAPERDALVKACTAMTSQSENCGCLATKADSALSRFDRLVLTAVYEADMTQVAQLAVSAAKTDLPPEKANAAFETLDARAKPLMEQCSLPQL